MFEKLPKIDPHAVRSVSKKQSYSPQDLAYMRSLSAAVLEKSTLSSRLILWTIALSVAWLVLWASYASVDEIARGEGRVIPSSRVQVVQNLEGGIVEELYVREGDNVQRGQPLLKIQDIRFVSSFQENRLRIQELKAKTIRLYAEANGLDFDSAPRDQTLDSSFLDEEKSLFLSNKIQLENAIEIINSQLRQRTSELTEIRARIRQLTRSLSLLKEEITLKEPMVKQGVVPAVELLQLRRQLNDAEGSLESAKLSVPRIESSIEETRGKIQDTVLAFRNKAKEQFNEVSAELMLTQQSIGALTDRVDRAIVRAPVSGTVKQLFTNTVGGVVKPGMDIMEIVPIDDALLVEVKVKPSDIAFIQLDQPATVKFTAYDFSIYGGLTGHVSQIGADTITDEKGNTYYVAMIKTDSTHLSSANEILHIKVGMVASVDIITGKKTVLDFLLKPILKAKHNALRER
ncbi:HlyD family type I secretion periplasmic adaptor subunit [Sulfurospirillum tamanense]|uniref:HlyD family type I secretion periplasmic adaptor subunit n=1 Tax=Sulfurospirillum tamanense TaxID=2813362 RepID=UPI0034E2842C